MANNRASGPPDPPLRVWGLLEVRPAAGIAVALSGAAVAMVLAVVGDLPGTVLGGAVFVGCTVLSVWQVTRLSFTDTGVRQDRWLFGVRRHTTVDWDRIEALQLDDGTEDESPSWWSLRLRAGDGLRLMLAGDVARRAGGGPPRRRHFRKHAKLIAAFHHRGVPFVDSREGDEPRPADEVGYARYLWHHDTPDTPPPTVR